MSNTVDERNENLIKLCEPIMEFLSSEVHPHHQIIIKEGSVELLETQIYYPTTKFVKD